MKIALILDSREIDQHFNKKYSLAIPVKESCEVRKQVFLEPDDVECEQSQEVL